MALLSANRCEFALVADMTGPLKNLVIGLQYRAAHNSHNQYAFAETSYQPMRWGHWKFYNGRVQCERNIRSLKEDYYLGNIPTQKFTANALYLEILLWAYDLVK